MGSQKATIAVSKAHAKDLIGKGTIKIGRTPCRVRARVNVPGCYRYLEFGHYNSNECKGPDKTGTCLNCGEEGHKAKVCTNTSFCTTCKIKCPH